jgi:hypothetical protein
MYRERFFHTPLGLVVADALSLDVSKTRKRVAMGGGDGFHRFAGIVRDGPMVLRTGLSWTPYQDYR